MNPGRLFVLQVWPDRPRFRAVLRAVDDAEAVTFDAVQPLCDYLAGIATAAVRAMTAREAASVTPIIGDLTAPVSGEFGPGRMTQDTVASPSVDTNDSLHACFDILNPRDDGAPLSR